MAGVPMQGEAKITVNGQELTTAQSLAVRVALSSYHSEMSSNPDALGNDDHGRRMTAAYRDRLAETLQLFNLD